MSADLVAIPSPPVQRAQDLRDIVVRSVRMEATEVVSLEVFDPYGADLPSWTPGAHIDLVLPSGAVRQYSLCSDPNDLSHYRVAVLRESDGRGGSKEVHDSVLVGRTLHMRGPRNHFPLEEANAYLLVAGGIGITPILAMARELSRSGKSFNLVYGGRSLTSMAFVDELRQLAGGALTVVPEDEAGRIDLARTLAGCASGTHVYCCGPEGLLQSIRSNCDEEPRIEKLHVERFTSSSEVPTTGDSQPATGFEVELRSTGAVFHVGPQDSLIDRVREHCPDVMTSCEEGFCGTCETRVLEGAPEHHDTILSDKERASNRTMMICVGRCSSERLVLDL